MTTSRAILVLLCAFAPWAYADQALEQTSVYLPENFAQYAPLNARDMVERIPGFRLENSRGNDQSRGFGEATENVLINGQRISSKSSAAADVLERIPASTVERIELLEGAELDIPGLSGLVVNVVAKAAGVSGTWSYQTRFQNGQKPRYFGGDLSVSGERGDLAWNVNLSSNQRGGAGEGEEIFRDPAGIILETRALEQRRLFPQTEASVGLRWTPASGLVANLNAEYVLDEREEREKAERAPSGETPFKQNILDNDDETSVELSGDVEFDVFAGRLKLIAVYADRETPSTALRSRATLDGDPIDDRFVEQSTDETETILRGEYAWSALQGSWDASLETALNTLDSRTAQYESENGEPLALVDGDGETVSVEETRSEGFLTYSRAYGDAVQVQVSLGAEISEIESSGPNGQSRSFTRPKGGLTLSWDYSDTTTINARVNRRVGQLDFFDFVSQVDLNDGDNQVGNVNIVPEQAWRAEIEVERKFGAWGASNLIVFGEALEDVVDQIPLGDGEGPGNIDRGARFGVELEGTFNFDPLGWNGAQLVYTATAQDSEIEDPLTGETRALNREDQLALDLEFRHDIDRTDLAWGIEFSPNIVSDTFRIDSIRTDRSQPGRLRVFLEHKDLWGLTARAELARPFQDIEKQTRQRFDPDRTGTLTETERSRFEDFAFLTLNLRGAF